MGRPQVVAIGGGHGLARALVALRRLGAQPVAVVTVADDGGSTGRLRRDLGIIAPGDLRQALVALADNRGLAALFAHRFGRGELEGHALGNLALVALAERAGDDFVAALDEAAKLLGCAGRVLPATTEPVQLKAQVAGQEVEGQARVARSTGRIERVWLEPSGPAGCAAAVAAVREADTVVFGPGSLFTSVIACLLVPDLARAVAETDARTVYVANLTTQPGETSGLSAADHVAALLEHVPGLVLDTVVLHDGPTPAVEGDPLGTDMPSTGVRQVLHADLLRREPDGSPAWGHDPERLAAALAPLVSPSGP